MARLVDPEKKTTTKPVEKALPKIGFPTYEMKIPSTGEVVTMRPFTVAEEKLLLMAVESKDMNEVVNLVKKTIKDCTVSGELDFDKLPFFDIDYAFIFLRAKSVGESVDLRMVCNNMVDEKKCGNVIEVPMNISNSEIYKDDTISDDIKLDSERGVKLKYPSYAILKRLDDEKHPINKKTALIVESIAYIYDKKTRHYPKDYTKGELKKFVETLTEENYKKLEKFVDNFPTFVVRLEATCNKCGFHHDVRYTDFEPFFT